MASSAFNTSPTWQWPEEQLSSRQSDIPRPTSSPPVKEAGAQEDESQKESPEQPKPQRMKHRPRTCRICLETVPPTYEPVFGNLASFVNPSPSVSYISSDPAAGRLIRPCKCKGSSRYVHEGCLQTWRHADPDYGKRNYWQCPTCGFRYHLERMTWARWISSTGTQIMLTMSILWLAMFILGFVADPIINLYLDPFHTISSVPLSNSRARSSLAVDPDYETSWAEHFLKGLASLGLLGFIKVVLAMSPWQWWNLRSSGLLARPGRANGSGRDRLASISWIVVVVGIGTFVWGVYKTIRAWSRRWLERAGERVLDVRLDDDDEAEDEVDETDDNDRNTASNAARPY